MEISKTIGIAAGVAGTLFLGYCIYFDHKRRKDPSFKKKLRESKQHPVGVRGDEAKGAVAGARLGLPNTKPSSGAPFEGQMVAKKRTDFSFRSLAPCSGIQETHVLQRAATDY